MSGVNHEDMEIEVLPKNQQVERIQGQENLPDICIKHIPFLIKQYYNTLADLKLGVTFTDLPLVVSDTANSNDKEWDTLSGLRIAVGYNSNGKPIHLEIKSVELFADALGLEIKNKDSNYAKAVMAAAVFHELKHVKQYVTKQHINYSTGEIDKKGEKEAREYSIFQLKKLIAAKDIELATGTALITEIKAEMDSEK